MPRFGESQFQVPAKSYLDLHRALVGMSMLELFEENPAQMTVTGCHVMVSGNACSEVHVMELLSCPMQY